MDYEIIIQAFWLIIPAYIANASALLVGGGTPIDFGKTYKDGKRILGDGKTWRGLFVGTFVGVTAGFGLSVAAKYATLYEFPINLSDFTGFPMMIPLIFSICFGALLGDIVESFFKRRVGKDRGEDWIPFDQLDFIVGVLVATFIMSLLLHISGLLTYNWFFTYFTSYHILVLLIATPFIHLFSNFVHRKTRQKTLPKKSI
ncbi:MAG: CDP-2,3-bis-(O-geranylgeranyl)-sn-glycerol synthase [Candidatus Thermoplasmatota archaeon]|nr:CDP-2,3-bis-(O-geranylgeranyl)-sn-glycerol synthase [Candidatus Thermoplasmatota archaeon]